MFNSTDYSQELMKLKNMYESMCRLGLDLLSVVPVPVILVTGIVVVFIMLRILRRVVFFIWRRRYLSNIRIHYTDLTSPEVTYLCGEDKPLLDVAFGPSRVVYNHLGPTVSTTPVLHTTGPRSDGYDMRAAHRTVVGDLPFIVICKRALDISIEVSRKRPYPFGKRMAFNRRLFSKRHVHLINLSLLHWLEKTVPPGMVSVSDLMDHFNKRCSAELKLCSNQHEATLWSTLEYYSKYATFVAAKRAVYKRFGTDIAGPFSSGCAKKDALTLTLSGLVGTNLF